MDAFLTWLFEAVASFGTTPTRVVVVAVAAGLVSAPIGVGLGYLLWYLLHLPGLLLDLVDDALAERRSRKAGSGGPSASTTAWGRRSR